MKKLDINGWRHLSYGLVVLSLLLSLAFGFIFVREDYPVRVMHRIGFGNQEYHPSDTEKYIIKGWSNSLDDFQADIVFLGDSITCGGKWSEYFPNESVCNLSIPGDSVQRLNYRSDMMQKLAPKKVFLLVGVNSLGTDKYKDTFNKYYRDIVENIHRGGTQVYIQSILPVREPSKVSNEKVLEANKIIKLIAEENGCTYIDLHKEFIDENGMLKEEYSRDGVHLKPAGYDKWVSILKEYI